LRRYREWTKNRIAAGQRKGANRAARERAEAGFAAPEEEAEPAQIDTVDEDLKVAAEDATKKSKEGADADDEEKEEEDDDNTQEWHHLGNGPLKDRPKLGTMTAKCTYVRNLFVERLETELFPNEVCGKKELFYKLPHTMGNYQGSDMPDVIAFRFRCTATQEKVQCVCGCKRW